MPANRETLAGDWFPITNPLDQAVPDYCVLMLTCAVEYVSGVKQWKQHGIFQMHFIYLRQRLWTMLYL